MYCTCCDTSVLAKACISFHRVTAVLAALRVLLDMLLVEPAGGSCWRTSDGWMQLVVVAQPRDLVLWCCT